METICAISTPSGVGGIAVARISGPDAINVCDRIWHGKRLSESASHTAHLGTVLASDGSPLDQAVATIYRAPRSFTGEDVVEISVHGSRYIQQALLASLINAGARLAAPGEFTRRAFVAGKMDLAQAEAVADLIASENRAAHRIAINQMRGGFSERLAELREQLLELASLLELELDFSEEDVEFASRQKLLDIATQVKNEVDALAASFSSGSAIKNGIPVAIVGPTNAGKSSLLNALLGDDRAIVSDIHGTTRDIVEDTLNLGDYTFRLMDTAGLRQTTDAIESLGIERSRKAAGRAAIIIAVVDRTTSAPIELPDTDAVRIIALNKSDIAPIDKPTMAHVDHVVEISALTGKGIDDLKQTLIDIASRTEHTQSSVLVTNARHYEALVLASQSVGRAISAMQSGLSGDLIAQDIRETLHHLASILGQITTTDILSTIFSRFCIGK